MSAQTQYEAAQLDTTLAITTLRLWVTEAQKTLQAEKPDPTQRARLGELIIAACRYLADREADCKRLAERAAKATDPVHQALKAQSDAMLKRMAGL